MADSPSNISNGIHNSKESNEELKSCFKHATENLSEQSKSDVSSNAGLCKGCSETMLSYIFLIQDMLNGLARKLSKDEVPNCCVQCLRQESQHTKNLPNEENFKNVNLKNEDSIILNGITNGECEALSPVFKDVSVVPELMKEDQTNQSIIQDINPEVTNTTEVESEPKKPRKSSRRNSRRISRELKEKGNDAFSENCANRNGWQMDFLYNVSSSIEPNYTPYNQRYEDKNQISTSSNEMNGSQGDIPVNHKKRESFVNHRSRSNSSDSLPLTPSSPILFFDNYNPSPKKNYEKSPEYLNFNQTKVDDSVNFDSSATKNNSHYHKSNFAKPAHLVTDDSLNHDEVEIDDLRNSSYSGTESNSCQFEADMDNSDKYYSGTESLDVEVSGVITQAAKSEKITNRNGENWKTLHDLFVDTATPKDCKSSEAFVTICRNNAEALGCLVLGSSLLLSRTSRKLCLLVFDDVDPVYKEPLSSIFHVVQHVRHLKSINETNLEFLKQKNLEKLNIWSLVQFSKCVFLNPDCLILRNCDELFQHEELSAVPDIGWPDCFNSGVFVFAPSIDTLSKLVEFSVKQGQNIEGDQMLLNTYFNSWSSDIGKKLSFIYNLMRNASYTYAPAYQRFGHNVKIVQFLGGAKPWEVKFFTQTGQLDGNVDVHPKHVRFFSEWINTFKIAVLKLFPQDVYSYAFNQSSVSAEEIGLFLRFPAHCKDLDENLDQPFHVSPKRQMVLPYYFSSPSARKTEECNISVTNPVCCQPSDIQSIAEATDKFISIGWIDKNCKTEDGTQNDKVETETILKDSPFDMCLPGSVIGDYQGMKAWEQGQIDYEGCDSSENIMNRLSFFIHRSV